MTKLSIDISVTTRRAIGSGILRDAKGKLIFAFYKEFGECDVLCTEILSLMQDLKLCGSYNFYDLLVEVDSSILVYLISSDVIGKCPLCSTL